jgi:hypothetical protein
MVIPMRVQNQATGKVIPKRGFGDSTRFNGLLLGRSTLCSARKHEEGEEADD